MEKLICLNCGVDNLTNAKYCSRCGHTLPKIKTEEVTAETIQHLTNETGNKTLDNANNITDDLKGKINFYIKKYKWVITLIIVLSFLQIFNKFLMPEILNLIVKTKTENNTNTQILNNKVKCNKSSSFGDVDICLPEINGMTECYSNPIVKKRADEIIANKENSVLALYLNNTTYKDISKINEKNFDDYFIIFGNNELKNIKIEKSLITELVSNLEGNYFKENWNDLQPKLEKSYKYVSIGKPVLIDSYMPNNKIHTNIVLTKYQKGKDEFIMLITLNMIQIKERLIWLTYYKTYEGVESVKKVKSNNDYIVLRFADENQ